MTAPYWLSSTSSEFPPVELALEDPNGLLAVGGDLTVERLVNAYRHGIFPWYSDGQPILWWSPDPRLVLYPQAVRISRSLRKTLRKAPFDVRMDTAFSDVLCECAVHRPDQPGTWITDEMQQAYQRLHLAGYAHSVECWQGNQLVGGLYGVAIGKIFFGESMFSRMSDASKVALVHLCAQLCRWQFQLIDCQVDTPHLISMGAVSIPRSDFVQQLERYCDHDDHKGHWELTHDVKMGLRKTGSLTFIMQS